MFAHNVPENQWHVSICTCHRLRTILTLQQNVSYDHWSLMSVEDYDTGTSEMYTVQYQVHYRLQPTHHRAVSTKILRPSYLLWGRCIIFSGVPIIPSTLTTTYNKPLFNGERTDQALQWTSPQHLTAGQRPRCLCVTAAPLDADQQPWWNVIAIQQISRRSGRRCARS